MRLPNPRWDQVRWHGDWGYPDASPLVLEVTFDDPEPIGQLLGPDGQPLKSVRPARRPIGFHPPGDAA